MLLEDEPLLFFPFLGLLETWTEKTPLMLIMDTRPEEMMMSDMVA